MAGERRATGIYAKHGKLYAVISDSEITNGTRKKKHRWVCTELADKPRNIKQAREFRENLLVQRNGGFKVNAKVTMG